MMRYGRIPATIVGVSLLAGALVGGVADAQGKKKKGKKGPVVVGKDADDDWGANVDPSLAPAGDALAQELVEGAIEKTDAKTLDFIITLKSLPAAGGIPEVTRYVWTLNVDGELVQLDGKFTNYSRGACDPTAGTCPPPRDPGEGPFSVKANCTDNSGTAVTCEEVGLVNATFEPQDATIRIPVPLKMLGAKPGSKIANGTQPGSAFTGIWAIPSVLFSQGNMPLDELIMTEVYTVPK